MTNTILFGNGINRLNSNNKSWNDLLESLKGDKHFPNVDLPYTMVYERTILDKFKDATTMVFDEFKIKWKIKNQMEDISDNHLYVEMFNLNVDNYLTTNYDYAFTNSVDRYFEDIRINDHSSESIYSIRRNKTIESKYHKKNFWQIHGEINVSPSIMLGLDHYCGTIGKIDQYIKGGYKHTKDGKNIIENKLLQKLAENEYSSSSWIELFFNSNMHILGLGLDYSETDLWWLINKRARMLRGGEKEFIKNRITYYCDESFDSHKKGMLESMNIIVEILPFYCKTNNDYKEYYSHLINKLNKEI